MKRFQGLTKWLSVFLLAVAIIFVYKTFDNFGNITSFFGRLMGILTPFIIGFGLAFLLYAPCSKIEKQFLKSSKPLIKRFARPVSVTIVYLILFGLLALLFYIAIPALVNALVDFINSLPGYYANIMAFLEEYTKEGGLLENFNLEEKVQDIYQYLMSYLTVDRIMGYFKGVASFASSLLDILMALIISVYMLAGRESLIRAVKAVAGLAIPRRGMDFCSYYAHKISKIFYSYFYSQALDACIVGVLATIGLLIARLPNAPALGMMLGFMNMIPYFGAIIGGVICVLVALLSGNLYGAIFVGIYILVMQQVDGNILQPRIVSNSVGIKAIYVLLAITVGGGFFGFWGIFLGVPVMAVLQMLLTDIINYRSRKLAAVEKTLADGPEETETKDRAPNENGWKRGQDHADSSVYTSGPTEKERNHKS